MRIITIIVALSTILLAAVPTNGLVGWYKFDGNPTDSSGKGHDAIVDSRYPVTYVPGLFDQAVKFGGFDNRGLLVIPNNQDINFLTNFTFVLWFNVQGTEGMDGNGNRSDTGAQTLFTKSSDRSGLTVLVNHIGPTNPNHFQLRVRNGRCCTTEDKSIVAFDDPASSTIKLGEWNCVAIKADDTNIYLYLNGTLLKSMPLSDFNINPEMANEDLSLGMFQLNEWYPFNGLMDNFLIYNRALSETEIQTLCQKPTSVTVPFDEKSKLLLIALFLLLGIFFIHKKSLHLG